MMIIRRRSFKKGEETRNACVSFFWFAVLMCVKREREREPLLFYFVSYLYLSLKEETKSKRAST